MAQDSPLLGYGRMAGNRAWNGLGWLEVAAGLFVMGYYVMIMAWVVVYFLECLSGTLISNTGADYAGHFGTVTENLPWVSLYTLLLLLACGIVVGFGLKKGIERLALWLMPLLLLLVVALGIWALSLNGARPGVQWYLHTDFTKINLNTILAALGQLFFSIGVGFSTAFVFGSYSGPDDDIVASTGLAVMADTLVAFLAGFMIFPALFAFSLPPDAGPSLVFITMAQLFAELPYGQAFGALFFLLLFLAGFTSLAATIEGITESFSGYFLWARRRSILLVLLLIGLLAAPNILSFARGRFSSLWGRSFYDWMDFLTNSIMLPLGGLLIVLFSTYVLRFSDFQKAANQGAVFFRISASWAFLSRFLIPLGLLAILLNSLFGLF